MRLKAWLWSLPLIPRLTVLALSANATFGAALDLVAAATAEQARAQAWLLAGKSLALAAALGLSLVKAAPAGLLPWALLFAAVRIGDIVVGIYSRHALRFIPSLPLAVVLLACLIPTLGEALGRREP